MKSPAQSKRPWASVTAAFLFFVITQQSEARVALMTNQKSSLLPDTQNYLNAPLTVKEAETVDLMAQMIASHLRSKMDSEIERLGLELYGAIKTDQDKADDALKGTSSGSPAKRKPKKANSGKNGHSHSHAKTREKYYKHKFLM